VRSRQRTPYLIGREQPLRDLSAALDEVPGPAGSLVLVSGEVGIGKTRLLEEFAARAPDALVVRGGCVENVPYAPWTEALWLLLDAVDPGLVDELPPGVRAQLGRLIPHLATEAPEVDEEDGQHLLFEAVVAAFMRAAARTKLVLVVDDVHWIDPASGELLRYIASNLRRIPVLLIVAFRGEDAALDRDFIAQLGRLSARRIALERLDEDPTAEMAALLLGPDARADDIAHVVHDAEGNPLFVEELVAALGSTGLPPTVRDLMLARFTSLDDDARHLVRTAALIGPRAPRAWLVGASGLGEDRARSAARAAVDAGSLVVGDNGSVYEFRHALLRQAVLTELVPDERVALHRDIAEALTEHPEYAVGVDRVSELARHWNEAEVAAPALRWLVAMARHAEETYAFEAAYRSYERALFWWDGVADATEAAGRDHAALLLDAADAAALAGHIERAADLAWSGLEEACALAPTRGVEAAGRVYSVLWTADRAGELFDFAMTSLLPVLDAVDANTRGRFLETRVAHLVGSGALAETRGPAAEMMAALPDITDPVLEARIHMVNAWCYEAYGEFEEADEEYERAAEIARRADVHWMLTLVLYNHAAFKTSVPDLDACLALLDRVDELVARFGIRRYLVAACCLRAVATCLQGDLGAARAALAPVENLYTEGFDAWARAAERARIDLCAGDYQAVLAVLEPETVGVPIPKDAERVIDISTLRGDASAWLGDLDGARRAIDVAEIEIEEHRETYWHGPLAMTGVRVEADAAVAAAAENSLAAMEHAQARAATIVAAWEAAVAQLERSNPLVEAYSRAIAAELARLTNDGSRAQAGSAAEAFELISMPYYATYFRWREAQALLDEGERPAATELLKHARATAITLGFGGLEAAITTLARSHQLRLGPGRTTVDGDTPLSVRELEVLRLMADGKSNPDIAELLFISRRTAAAHVSNILRKIDATSRVEAVSEAHRRGYV
jgi:DNA-binding CsgD family transcriptional regulator/tetratricopeptide (TPR) repeat protein